MDPAQFDPLVFLREQLISAAGGYLRNPTPRGTCPLCRGISGIDGQPECSACARFATSGAVDQLGFMIYATKGTQSGAMMYRYKDPQPPAGPVKIMRLLVGYNLLKHLVCAEQPAGPPQFWATIPSLRRPGPSRLAEICAPFLESRGLQHVPLQAASHDPTSRRWFDPDLFDAPRLTGHVLLLDDTWVTGNHLYSGAAALKTAGASRVTALVVSRWLDSDWGSTPAFLRNLPRAAYSPDVCPFTGRFC